jgi:hypothetical protein
VATTRPTADLTPGIPDPDRPDRWLVQPWPHTASFCDVVRHFLTTYVGNLQGERSVTSQLAYFEGYQAALAKASTHELTNPAAWRWHDDLTSCITSCITTYQGKQAIEVRQAAVCKETATVDTPSEPMTPGIPDPDDPGRWLVRPWPVSAGFCEVVRHFVMASFSGIYDSSSTIRRLVYFEGYQAALSTASNHELTDPGAWQWHDELVGCIADCVAIFQAKAMVEGLEQRPRVRRLQPPAPASIPTSFRPGRAS